ncbi:protein translocase subunit SecD [Candidatus Uhrbacteria bacterium]|nr:protein translocase subunit SecD [Candidatus Uhrbacteria bacterium]
MIETSFTYFTLLSYTPADSMQTSSTSVPSRRRVRRRVIGLAILFLAAASFSFPGPLNWLARLSQDVIGIQLGNVEKPFVLGLDLQGGTRLEYEADVSKVSSVDRKEALVGVRDVIERRVNSLGVSEPLIKTIQAGDSWRVHLELAGIKDIREAIKLIGETPILEFKEEGNPTPPLTDAQRKQIETQNTDAKNRAHAILKEVQKPKADFGAIAQLRTETNTSTAGDLGFLKEQGAYNDLLTVAKTVSPGTIIPYVIQRSKTYAVAKVEEIKDQSNEVHVHHLLLGYKGAASASSDRSKEEARAKIAELRTKATPENFAELAGEHSEEPGAKETKGDLKWLAKGSTVEAFEKAAWELPIGAISGIVETEFGFHLIWKKEERVVHNPRVRAIEIKRLVAEDLVPSEDPWKSTKLTGRELSSARVDFDQQTGAIQVALQFNTEGAKLFQEITKRNIGKPVGIFLDGDLISSPQVSNEIIGGQAVITGNFGIEEAKILARRLQAGALPVPIKLIAQQTVGPTLGADSLQKSLSAGLIGFLLVGVYMLLLYRFPGFISILALVLYAAISAALFKLIPVTLTLSGIAGFILSIGIAVDANVLVFERLKEEWLEGKGFAQALEDAFRRAWPSIRDGHATVLISCAVLYWFSSSIIRGFALTLAIGTLISLFTAVVSCRTLLRFVVGTPITKFGWLFLKPKERVMSDK